MKRRHLAGLLLILCFFAFSAVSYQSSLTPYVTFAQARNTTAIVQIKGVIAGNTVTYEAGKLLFQLKDDRGETATVIYTGSMPDGLEQAEAVVAVGNYDMGTFIAKKLLVKCPSKYQGSGK